MTAPSSKRIVMLIPCLNEEVAIGKVIDDFRQSIPEAEIIVFDNNSTDRTAEIAREKGVQVIFEPNPGKGNVVASMFRKIKADYYMMVDGDDTYAASHARQLLQPVLDGEADMVVATRLGEYTNESFRPLHVFGNNLVKTLVNWVFHTDLKDIMSGYRAFNREVVEVVPILSGGFEVETEMTLRTLESGLRIAECVVPYKERPVGSVSKLNTFRDGYKVLAKIVTIAKAYKPFTFFGGIGLVLGFIGMLFGLEVIVDYMSDNYVQKVPTAVLSVAFMLLSFGTIGIGIILNTLNYRHREMARLIQNIARRTGHED